MTFTERINDVLASENPVRQIIRGLLLGLAVTLTTPEGQQWVFEQVTTHSVLLVAFLAGVGGWISTHRKGEVITIEEEEV